ncbi:hypothetical protein DM01DRAFT_1332985, partial [Hesseltinella vesiculosa]
LSNAGRARQHCEAASGREAQCCTFYPHDTPRKAKRVCVAKYITSPSLAPHDSQTLQHDQWILSASVFSFTRKPLGRQGRLYHGQ